MRDDPRGSRSRRENMMERRLRKARGEEVPDELELDAGYDDEDDEDDAPRGFGGGYDGGYGGYRRPVAYGPPGGGGGCGQGFLVGALILLAAVVVGGLLFNQTLSNVLGGVPRIPDIATIIVTPTPRIITSAAVVQRVQQLSRLETASYTIQTVIEVNQSQGNPIFDFFAGDALLLIAEGTVIAGVDLSNLSPEAVTVAPDGRTVTLTLPPAEVFDVALDNAGTRVYSRERGFFAPDNVDLETLARQQAEAQILAAACEDGVLSKANQQAEQALRQFLGLIDEVQVVVVPATPGPCLAPSDPTPAPAPTP
jgi:hypothetical protein